MAKYTVAAQGNDSRPIMATRQADQSGFDQVIYAADVFKTIAAVTVTAGTPVSVWTTSTSTKRFRFLGWAVSMTTVGSVIFDDNTTEMIRTPILATVGMISPPMGQGIISASANNALKIDVTVNGVVSGYVFGTEE